MKEYLFRISFLLFFFFELKFISDPLYWWALPEVGALKRNSAIPNLQWSHCACIFPNSFQAEHTFQKRGGEIQMLEKTFINKPFKLQRQLAPCLFLTSEFHGLSFPDNLLLKFSSLQG